MADRPQRGRAKVGVADHAVSALSAWFGDYLERSGNELHQPMAFFEGGREVAPETLPAPERGKLCVLLHGLGCNEGLWTFPAPHAPDDYGALLQRDFGHLPLYVRFNSGLRISRNGSAFDALLDAYDRSHPDAIREITLIGHSMGGLVMRSACHLAQGGGRAWVRKVRDCFYLGSPHLGAPLEKVTNVADRFLGAIDTTATRVISDLLRSRAAGVKDLRHGNLLDEDWLDHDPDALLQNRRVPVPWLESSRHRRIIGHALPGAGALGDAMVMPGSAAGLGEGEQPAAPGEGDVVVMAGLDHLALSRHPQVYAEIARMLREQP